MTLLLLRFVHILSITFWLGAGFSVPVVADIRRSLALGPEHGPPLIARLMTTTKLVIPSAVIALVSGISLVMLRGGFDSVPIRYDFALGLSVSIFVVGGTLSNPAIKALRAAIERGDRGGADQAARRFIRWVRFEDVLRLTVLALMVFPV